MDKRDFLVLYIGDYKPNLGMLLSGILDLIPSKVQPKFHCVETINLGLHLLLENDSYDLIMTHQDDNIISNENRKYCSVEELIEYQIDAHSTIPMIIMADRVMSSTPELNYKQFKIHMIAKDNVSAISDAITASAWSMLANVPIAQSEQSVH